MRPLRIQSLHEVTAMAKNTEIENQNAEMQPDELNALKEVTEEFIKRLSHFDTEMETLKEAKRDLIEEFKTKLDMKTLQAALRIVKIKKGVAHKHTFDCFMEVLEPEIGS